MGFLSDSDVEKYIGNSNITIVEAMKKIDQNASGLLFIVENGMLAGAVSDGDIRRWLIQTGKLDALISQLMNRKPKSITRDEDAKEIFEKYLISIVPVVDEYGKILRIIRKEAKVIASVDEEILKHIPLVIMAGGKGTRLYPYTKIIPKPLIPINDIPIVERIINEFCKYKVDDIFMTVNYKKEMIKSYFKEADHEYGIRFVEESVPLGTAGSLTLLPGITSKNIIITNCDILIRADYADIYKYHESSDNDMTVVSAVVKTTIPYGVLHSENGRVKSVVEKPSLNHVVNTGMYIVKTKYLERIPNDTFYNMTDLMNELIENNCKVGMYPIGEEAFLDMGEFVEMQRMEQELKDELS